MKNPVTFCALDFCYEKFKSPLLDKMSLKASHICVLDAISNSLDVIAAIRLNTKFITKVNELTGDAGYAGLEKKMLQQNEKLFDISENIFLLRPHVFTYQYDKDAYEYLQFLTQKYLESLQQLITYMCLSIYLLQQQKLSAAKRKVIKDFEEIVTTFINMKSELQVNKAETIRLFKAQNN